MDPYLEEPGLWSEFRSCLFAAVGEAMAAGLDREQYEVVFGRCLEVRRRDSNQLLTLLYVLDAAERLMTAQREAYRELRQKAREDRVNFVEIDLLLQGEPTLEFSRKGLPKWHYMVTATRAVESERHELYTATLDKKLPRFRVPLSASDHDNVLDLQVFVHRCYDAGDYLTRIDYRRDPAVPLSDDDRCFLDAQLVWQGRRLPHPPHDEITLAAYYLWQQEGCPQGCDKEHWYKALAQLSAVK
jgi:hypothetical protein